MEIEACVVDEDADREKIKRELEAERLNQESDVAGVVAGADDKSGENATEESQSTNKSSCIMRVAIFLLLLFIGVVAIVYFATDVFQSSASEEPGLEVLPTDSPTDTGDAVEDKEPTMSPTTVEPTLPSTEDFLFDPPLFDDCEAIRNGEPVSNQDTMEQRGYELILEMTVDMSITQVELVLQDAQDVLQQEMVPALVGCGEIDSNKGDDARKLKDASTKQIHSATTRMLAIEPYRYGIGNCYILSLTCLTEEDTCSVVKVPVDCFLKGSEIKNFQVAGIISDVFKELDLPFNFSLREVRGTTPTNTPTLSPTGSPSLSPSLRPTLKPTVAATGGPTPESMLGNPTASPTRPPTPGPTPNPTPGPTPNPTPGPTPNPTPGPTPGPTPNPTPFPTPPPTTAPVTFPTPPPTPNPTKFPTQSPTIEDSMMPTVEASSSPSPQPSWVPSMKPSAAPSAAPSPSPSTSQPSASPSRRCFESNEELSGAVDDWFDTSASAVEAQYGPMGAWCFGSGVTSFNSLFLNRDTFNEDISNWDVSGITDFENFLPNTNFNQDISGWNVSSATNFAGTFRGTPFNQDISSWDVSSVTKMVLMFFYADSFNQNIGSWNTSSVTRMDKMFEGAAAFNGNIENWDVSNVINMVYMFSRTESFNRPIGSWDVSSVEDMYAMFFYATAFNQNIADWELSSVHNMQQMFGGASLFNQNLCAWGDHLTSTSFSYTFTSTSCPYTSNPNLSSGGPFCHWCP